MLAHMSEMALHTPVKPIIEPDKPKRLEVRGKLRQSLDAMVWDGLPWDEAAKSVGFSIQSMRKAFARPHVLAYLKAEREVLRASASPRNIHRLIEIRDKADNMPAIQAIRTLEQLGESEGASASIGRASPGLVIVIQGNVNASLTRSDAKPLIEHEVGSHDADD
jgi:hypothetical protein